MKKTIGLIIAIGFLAWLPSSAWAYERITDFSSAIAVNNDGTITVEETITTIVEHDKINHGIYRDLIADYTGPDDDYYYRAGYEIISVKRNGLTEPFHLERLGSNLRIYIGDEENLVPMGEQIYELTYQAYGLMRYFEEFDELYWNVTGNNWEFPIEQATAKVSLPWTQKEYQTVFSYKNLYTGSAGSQDQNGYFDQEGDNFIYKSNRTLNPGEGLTIVLGFPTGRIAKLLPELREFGWLVKFLNSLDRQERVNILGFLSLLIFFYFTAVWFFKGRDPRKGTIIPQYEAPAGLSPADVAHVVSLGGGFEKSLGATIISLAVKGKIKITKRKSFFSANSWQLDRINKDSSGLNDDEKLLLDNLFKDGDQLKLPSTDADLSMFMSLTFRQLFRKKWTNVAYVNNTIWAMVGILFLVLVLMAYLILDFESSLIAFFIFFPIFFIILFFLAIVKILKDWSLRRLPFLIFLMLFFAGFGFSAVIIFTQLVDFSWPAILLDNIHLIALFFVFVILALILKFIKKPTIEGRKLLNEIKGFKLFLVTTEKDRIEFFHPIDKTPETFEKYFPYAIALGVADKWAARFENLFQGTDGQAAYAPVWYGGSLAGISGISSISSIGSSVGSSLVSSGSAGGGGGSGGGGGGGGGGGW